MSTKKSYYLKIEKEVNEWLTKNPNKSVNDFIDSKPSINTQRKYKGALRHINVLTPLPKPKKSTKKGKSSTKKIKTAKMKTFRSRTSQTLQLANTKKLIREYNAIYKFNFYIDLKSLIAFENEIQKDIWINFFKNYSKWFIKKICVAWYDGILYCKGSSNSKKQNTLELPIHSKNMQIKSKKDCFTLIQLMLQEIETIMDESRLDINSMDITFRLTMN